MNAFELKLAEAMKIRRGRGRPRTASDETRLNNYKDPNGHYNLTAGLKPWHERVVDCMLLNPSYNRTKLAQEFNVTPEWMGSLLNSDAFKEYCNARMEAHQRLGSTTIVSKMQGVASRALDKLDEKLQTKDLPAAEVREIAKLSLQSLGFGPTAAGVKVQVGMHNQQTTMNFVGVNAEAVEKARQEIARTRELNTERVAKGSEDFSFVTQSLQPQPEAVEDAIVIRSYDEGGSSS